MKKVYFQWVEIRITDSKFAHKENDSKRFEYLVGLAFKVKITPYVRKRKKSFYTFEYFFIKYQRCHWLRKVYHASSAFSISFYTHSLIPTNLASTIIPIYSTKKGKYEVKKILALQSSFSVSIFWVLAVNTPRGGCY